MAKVILKNGQIITEDGSKLKFENTPISGTTAEFTSITAQNINGNISITSIDAAIITSGFLDVDRIQNSSLQNSKLQNNSITVDGEIVPLGGSVVTDPTSKILAGDGLDEVVQAQTILLTENGDVVLTEDGSTIEFGSENTKILKLDSTVVRTTNIDQIIYGNKSFQNNIVAPSFIGDGSQLTSVNANMLDGQDGTYYLNYNNLTNKPSIPSVGNATINISAGDGLSDGGTFTTNQNLNSTISIKVDGSVVRTSGTQEIGGAKTFTSNVTAPGFIGDGSQLTNVNAELLDGQDSSYFLNYNNLINKPSIPVVNNGTITISAGDGLSSGGDFTTNQATSETITLNVDSSVVRTATSQTITGRKTFEQHYVTASITGSDAKFASITGSFSGDGSNIVDIDYQNIIGTPAIPVVNNGTITISAGDGLSNGGDFTTNQATSETITLNIDNSVVRTSGNQTIDGLKTFSSSIIGNLQGNATTVTNGVYTTNISSHATTGVTAGFGLSGGGTTGTVSLSVDLLELPETQTGLDISAGQIIVIDNNSQQKRINLEHVSLSYFANPGFANKNGNNVFTQTNTFSSTSNQFTGSFSGDVDGNADTATTLETPRTISSTGDVSWSVSFDGSSDVTSAAVLSNVVRTTDVDQSIDGTKTFLNDVVVNDLTIGKGNNSYDTNVAFGFETLANATYTAGGDTPPGQPPLYVFGDNNIAIGYRSLKNITTGRKNVSIGTDAFLSGSIGSANIAIGYNSLTSGSASHNNTIIGNAAAQKLTSGNKNTIIGNSAGSLLTSADNCLLLGDSAAHNDTTLSDTVILSVGYGKERMRIDSNGNAVIGGTDPQNYKLRVEGSFKATSLEGDGSLVTNINSSNIVGDDFVRISNIDQNIGGTKTFLKDIKVNNITIGTKRGNAFFTRNTIIGEDAGASIAGSGLGLTFIGFYSGKSNDTGNYNTFIGQYSGYSNTSGSNNTFIGEYSGYNNVSGNSNIFIGSYAGYSGQTTNSTVILSTGYLTERLRIDDNGNATIGGTDPQGFKLRVHGSFKSDSLSTNGATILQNLEVYGNFDLEGDANFNGSIYGDGSSIGNINASNITSGVLSNSLLEHNSITINGQSVNLGQTIDISTVDDILAGSGLLSSTDAASGQKTLYIDPQALTLDYINNRVGIGGVTSPTQLLDVASSTGAVAGEGAKIGEARIGTWVNTAYALFSHNTVADVSTSYALLQSDNGSTYLNSALNSRLHFLIGNSTKMVVHTNGCVGIGTTVPTDKLEVVGTLRFPSIEGGTAIRIDGGSSTDTTIMRVDANNNGTSDSSNLGFSVKYMGSRSGNNNSFSIFSDNASAATQIEALTVLQDGKIGINNSDPQYTLDVNGEARINGTIRGRSTSGYLLTRADDTNTGIYSSIADSISLITDGQYRLHIRTDGNVAIGSTMASHKLHVNGTTQSESVVIGDWSSNSDYMAVINSALYGTHYAYALLQHNTGATYLNAASGQSLHLRINNVDGIKIDSSRDVTVEENLTVNGTITELSTRKVKKNIRSLGSQLNKIKRLNPVSYKRRKSKDNRKELGFISEEVKEVYPELVTGEGVNYSKMVSILVGAVKELTEKVEQQDKIIQHLINKM